MVIKTFKQKNYSIIESAQDLSHELFLWMDTLIYTHEYMEMAHAHPPTVVIKNTQNI